MGFAGCKESNEELLYERLNQQGESFPVETFFDCYYCSQSFRSIKLRNDHIRKQHNSVGPLLNINGKIVVDKYFVDKFYSAKVILNGFKNVEIIFDDYRINYFHDKSDEIDLIPYFKTEKSHFDLKIGGKQIPIFKYQERSIKDIILNDIIEKWEIQTNKGEGLNPSCSSYSNKLNEAELLYISGFFEYYIACSQRIDLRDKKVRYETAFSILSSFSNQTPKARIILKIIAFKFNWIEKLEFLSKLSLGVFNTIVDFYQGKQSLIENEDSEKNEYRVYIEDDIEDCFNAIKAYQLNNWSLVNVYLSKWNDDDLELIEDINKKDRILLLKARQMRHCGKYLEAKKYYLGIKTPYFKIEVEKFNQ